jgi:hypothetical protein
VTAPAYRKPEPVGVEDLLGRLESVRRNGEGRWMAKCPAHGDKTASLSVRVGDDGKVLLHCFAGCRFTEIAAALSLEARQLFPAPTAPWAPRPKRPDPDREAREFLEHLRTLREPPPPDRLRKELRFVGRLLLGGTQGFAEVPAAFRAESLTTFPLRVLFQAMAELAKQGTPRRWFSPQALWREVERVGGRHWRRNVFFWSRAAVGEARSIA